MATRERKDAGERKQQLLDAAYKIAQKQGIRKVTRAAVARECKVSDGLLNRYFDGREGLRWDVLQYAVEKKDAKTLHEAGQIYELPNMPRDLFRQVKALQVL
jgi:AcrR family transcriptional regulator